MNESKYIELNIQNTHFCLHRVLCSGLILLLGGCVGTTISNSTASTPFGFKAIQPENNSSTASSVKVDNDKNSPSKNNIPFHTKKNTRALEKEDSLMTHILLDEESYSLRVNTEEEKILILNKKLEQSMASFDNMLASENTDTETQEDAMSSDALNNSNSESIQEDADTYPASASEATSKAGAKNEEGNKGENASNDTARRQGTIAGQVGSSGNQAGFKIPEDVSDGTGDDIIARQIREAAIKERDPKLQEKLWAEYRKYKQDD